MKNIWKSGSTIPNLLFSYCHLHVNQPSTEFSAADSKASESCAERLICLFTTNKITLLSAGANEARTAPPEEAAEGAETAHSFESMSLISPMDLLFGFGSAVLVPGAEKGWSRADHAVAMTERLRGFAFSICEYLLAPQTEFVDDFYKLVLNAAVDRLAKELALGGAESLQRRAADDGEDVAGFISTPDLADSFRVAGQTAARLVEMGYSPQDAQELKQVCCVVK